MLLDLGVLRQLLDGGDQVLLCLVEIAAAEVRPAEAVEIGAVVRILFQRALNELNGLVELLATHGQQVAEVVERLGIHRLDCNDLPQHALGIGPRPASA